MTQVSQVDLIAGAIAGKLVSFPTDTVPALAAKPEFASKIYRLKQRPANKPLILMGASAEDLLPYVVGNSQELEIWQQTIQKYLPGAITFVLPASERVPPAMNPTNSGTIGIRIPANYVACQILRQTGALATTSANLSGQTPLTTMEAIASAFPGILVLDDRKLDDRAKRGSGLPSTVVRWTGSGWTVLRQGGVKIESTDLNRLGY